MRLCCTFARNRKYIVRIYYIYDTKYVYLPSTNKYEIVLQIETKWTNPDQVLPKINDYKNKNLHRRDEPLIWGTERVIV